MGGRRLLEWYPMDNKSQPRSVPMARSRGFTLIELMTAVALVAILVALAIPSFVEFRNRMALRGGADQVVSFWGDSRFEALRRNQLVKVAFRTAGSDICLGAATTADPADNTACDCFTPGACDVAAYPQSQADWRSLRVPTATTIGNGGSGVVVIDPKRGNITERADAGFFSLQSPASGSADYRLNIAVDRNGRAFICEPAAAPSKLPQYTNRRC
jgi:prepilin-type N-terminal cleavage/methylation domain-containing protein